MIPLYKINKLLQEIKKQNEDPFNQVCALSEEPESPKEDKKPKKAKIMKMVSVDNKPIILDDDKLDFKILTSFVNSYKSKLMIRGEAGFKPMRGKTKAEEMPLTKQQLKTLLDEDERDITLDYDIF